MRTVSNCLTEINNTQKDHAKDLHVVMPMYNLVECSDNYSRTFGSLYQFCRDEPHATKGNSGSIILNQNS